MSESYKKGDLVIWEEYLAVVTGIFDDGTIYAAKFNRNDGGVWGERQVKPAELTPATQDCQQWRPLVWDGKLYQGVAVRQ